MSAPAAARPEVWIEPLGTPESSLATAREALSLGFDTLLLAGDASATGDELTALTARRVERRGAELVCDEEVLGPVIELEGPGDMAAVHQRRGRDETILLRCFDWKVIPLENLIADFQASPTRLFSEATTADEVRLLLETLEVGTDGVVLRTDTPGEVTALARWLDQVSARPLELTPTEVIEVRPTGSGDRACVDTVSLLAEGEGLLVGSSAAALALVVAETADAGYVAPRPFRVNAGPVHAYTLVPGGRTRYLAELAAGDEVLVAGSDGRLRSEVVGRIKIERRPLLLVRYRGAKGEGSLLAQNAETVRLATATGAVPVTELAPGTEVLVHHAVTAARHFGMAIAERIEER